MTVVLDCNILVMCLTSRSPYYPIYRALTKGKFNLAITTEIVLEYEEIIQQKYGILTANNFITLLHELPNVHYITTYYRWLLIDADPDDNKYSDCAIAGKATYWVTEDKHFDILKSISFPQVTTISIDEFAKLIQTL